MRTRRRLGSARSDGLLKERATERRLRDRYRELDKATQNLVARCQRARCRTGWISKGIRSEKSAVRRLPGREVSRATNADLAPHAIGDQPHGRQSWPSGGAARAREGSLHACAETPALFSWPAARSRGQFFGRAIEPDQPRTSVRGRARPCRRCRLTSESNGKSVKKLEAPIVL
jgi:hypothetical protein